MTTRSDDTPRETDTAAERSSAARLFDIRRIIGGLFLLYGLLLLGAGVLDRAASAKAAGIDVNLWTGLAMAVFGLALLAWMRLRPLRVEPGAASAERAAGDRPTERATLG